MAQKQLKDIMDKSGMKLMIEAPAMPEIPVAAPVEAK